MIDQKIAIVGGTGQFGQHLGERLEENNEIVISGSSVERAKEEAEPHGWGYGEGKEIVKGADIVIISVPIAVTVDVIHEVGPNVSDSALLCDVTSVKQKPVEAMKQYSDEVLGMHPMYAPSNSIKGQKIVMCPEKGKKWSVMEEFWEEHGADLHFTDPKSHDKATSIVQGLMHFSELVMADVIRKSELSTDEMNEYSTPIYQLITDLTARMLNQKAELYGSIQNHNPEIEDVREEVVDSAEELREVIKDDEEFSKKFEELGESFDLEGAQERTDKVIEFLSNDVRDD
ncbi:prephenate dehydrogenase/arogenate dehydrogenase family protein [Candidatus Nanohalobium constans]|uniref:Prephenate dehydrogenase n=1 Tax=Candidatus Nanohalobium constans TaxID=2565781 RepID=A0A5Q0UGB3_9ARCH|nr:prephenate dehydrogenase/arogenate dehydrogenase family protein [Candidatus Nanohalobium constans]QGA79985.1 prephenate dehydrogenase [Candidatus Nanohalobium constans]